LDVVVEVLFGVEHAGAVVALDGAGLGRGVGADGVNARSRSGGVGGRICCSSGWGGLGSGIGGGCIVRGGMACTIHTCRCRSGSVCIRCRGCHMGRLGWWWWTRQGGNRMLVGVVGWVVCLRVLLVRRICDGFWWVGSWVSAGRVWEEGGMWWGPGVQGRSMRHSGMQGRVSGVWCVVWLLGGFLPRGRCR
jgi:hypothetical protein